VFDTVLIANRGEIAVRVTRTLRRMGIRSVAVYSDADADARHVREADVAVRLGPAPARDSYLSIERLLDAAARTGAQAIHPGYGFLSESAGFVAACAAAGLVFIGPSAAAVDVMGDKIRAKLTVMAAGVPVVPGRTEAGMTDADLIAAADEVGYPVLVKPSAGGGGKGMRMVQRAADLTEAIGSARREAAASFADDTLFIERFVARPRHIEVQVIGDQHGTTLHLGERECSLQRRHQKVIEEAPSPFLNDAQRERYGGLAVAAAVAVDYTGVGTVEFIVSGDSPDEPFFMEMNTRLQVEHPVTEMVTGLDLVELQVRVAAGEPLPLGQSDVILDGHAVEARVYAEDPEHDFLPTGGPALVVHEAVGDGIRTDSSLVAGSNVGTTYDPMLSKVIGWAPDRNGALDRLDQGLRDTVLLGCTTNIGFLRALVDSEEVRAGRLDTGLLERSLPDLIGRPVDPVAYAAFALTRARRAGSSDPWDTLAGWRASAPAILGWDVLGPAGERLPVTLSGGTLTVAGAEYAVRCVTTGDDLLVSVDGVTVAALVAEQDPTTWVAAAGHIWAVTEAPPASSRSHAVDADSEVTSPMPGSVTVIVVQDGDEVEAGDALVAIEAMKMEHLMRAPAAGTVEVLVRVGDQVQVGQPLARVLPQATQALPG
jgi:acetyl-CoA/propionyl-CoA carboxylase biotin carboxyl carrier protein